MCDTPDSGFRILGRRLNASQGKKPSRKTGITTTIVKCSHCGLIFSNPMPVPTSIEDHYALPPEEYWKEEYFLPNQPFVDAAVKKVKEYTGKEGKIKCLDIGAGIGKTMNAWLHAGFDAYGFEPSKPFYDKAISKMNISQERIKHSSIEEAEYSENSFDYIAFNAVLEHLYDPSASIQKAMKWLKPEGIIEIEVPSNKWFVNRLVNFYYKLTSPDYVANISPMHPPFHLYEFSLKSFELNGIMNGYKIDQHYFYVAPTHMPKILDSILTNYMEITKTGMQLFVLLKKK